MIANLETENLLPDHRHKASIKIFKVENFENFALKCSPLLGDPTASGFVTANYFQLTGVLTLIMLTCSGSCSR